MSWCPHAPHIQIVMKPSHAVCTRNCQHFDDCERQLLELQRCRYNGFYDSHPTIHGMRRVSLRSTYLGVIPRELYMELQKYAPFYWTYAST